MQTMRDTESSRNLYDIAEPQYGFFTTKQAKEAGYDESKHAYHVRAGKLDSGTSRHLPAPEFSIPGTA
jgi:hypothetical protein